MKDFQQKVVVITGGATGIGFALAKQFAGQGAKIVLCGRRLAKLSLAQEALAGLCDADVRIHQCDMTKREEVEQLADFAWREYGHVDVIVNNAGVGPKLSSVIDTEQADIESIFAINFYGAWNGVSVFGRRFLQQGTPAAIYNVGSENCFFNAVPKGAGYVASKHALMAMTNALREEVPDFISVSLICPGLVKSELTDLTDFGMDADEFAEIAMTQIILERYYVVSHAYNMERIHPIQKEIEQAFAEYAPRYHGDEEFDVRTLGARHSWW